MRVTALLGFAVGVVLAQRPTNTSICDYYTTALLKNNTAANQYAVLTLVVNTALIGNYTQPNKGIAVNGILNPGMYNGTAINLLPYFDGSLASTNAGGTSGAPQNFLDDGGKRCKPSHVNCCIDNLRGGSAEDEHAIQRQHGLLPIVRFQPL
jgi:hypothetical protein